jgi:acetyl-CoA carboxylase biotin carboxylase subunit
VFRRILVANRGEIALRIVRACHELGIEAVCVYSTADSESLHLRYADVAVCVGPADARQSYLSIPNIVMAAKNTRCEAVHPGYGFLAENSVFARACADNDLVFIGPSPDTMDRLGDKSLAKQIMADAGLPTIPGSQGTVQSAAEAVRLAAQIGYPVMLKASAGGGGRGMRQVEGPDQVERASW